MIYFSEQVILFRQPELIAQIQPLEGMKILQLNDKQQLLESERANQYSILIISIEELDIINMALISCKYRYLFIINLQKLKDKNFSRQNNSKFMEILQLDNFNQKLQQVFIEYQKSLIKQRTTLQIEKSWVDMRKYINIIYYKWFLQQGDWQIIKNQQSEDMKTAICDFQAESERYINQKYVDDSCDNRETRVDRDDRQLQLGLLASIVDYLQKTVNEEDIMEKLLLMYTEDSFFFRMLQEYLRLLIIKNLYFIRLPMYYCMKGLQTNSIVKKKIKQELFRGQYIDKKELSIYMNQEQGTQNIMLSFLSCSTRQIAKEFIANNIDGLEKVLLNFQGFQALKGLKSDYKEMEKCLGPFVELDLQQKVIGNNQKIFQFKNEKFIFDDDQFGELKRQKQKIMDIFKTQYKHSQMFQAEFSLMYDRDPNFVIDILENQQFSGFDETMRLSKLQIAHRMAGNLTQAIKYGEQSIFLSKPSDIEQDLELRFQVGWAYLDNQEFSAAFKLYKDCYFSENNKIADYRAQILNNVGCIYWNVGQFQKAEQCQYQSKTIKDKMGDQFDQLSKSIARINLYHGKFLILMHQNIPDEIKCKGYQEVLDQLMKCVAERAIVREYCHSFDLVVLQRIAFVLLQMGKFKESQDYCDFVDNLITKNNNFYESVGVSYYIRAKLLIDQKDDIQADDYFQKSINYLKENQYFRRIELLRIYSDYEDFCLRLDKMDQAIICRNEYLRISSYLLKEIIKIRELITQEEEQLILEGEFE